MKISTLIPSILSVFLLSFSTYSYSATCNIGKKITKSPGNIRIDYAFMLKPTTPRWTGGYHHDATFYNNFRTYREPMSVSLCRKLARIRADTLLRGKMRVPYKVCAITYLENIMVFQSHYCTR